LAIEYRGTESGAVPAPRGPYSPAVVWNELVFVSGLLAMREDGTVVSGGIREEAVVVLRNLSKILEDAGSGLDRVLSVTVYLRDIGELPAFNEVYEEMFKPPFPARSAVQASPPAGFRVELAAVACLK